MLSLSSCAAAPSETNRRSLSWAPTFAIWLLWTCYCLTLRSMRRAVLSGSLASTSPSRLGSIGCSVLSPYRSELMPPTPFSGPFPVPAPLDAFRRPNRKMWKHWKPFDCIWHLQFCTELPRALPACLHPSDISCVLLFPHTAGVCLCNSQVAWIFCDCYLGCV